MTDSRSWAREFDPELDTYTCEFCEQKVDRLDPIEIVRDDGEIRTYALCEGCIDELEYAPTTDKGK